MGREGTSFPAGWKEVSEVGGDVRRCGWRCGLFTPPEVWMEVSEVGGDGGVEYLHLIGLKEQ